MFTGNTVMVIGAGASKEVGFPTGAELKDQIAERLDFRFSNEIVSYRRKRLGGDDEIFDTLSRRSHSEGQQGVQHYLDAARLIREAMPTAKSIDHFLNSHKGNKYVEICGKLAIAKSILQAEHTSKLFVSDDNTYNRLDLKKLNGTWYLKLGELLLSCDREDLPNRLRKIQFVVFDYDRCIEQFLIWGLRIYFGMDEGEAAGYADLVKIYHPYGSVGRLPWQKGTGNKVGFGSKSQDLDAVASQIKTFTEGTDPESSDIVALRKALDDSDIAIFLGFGFHQLNISLITPEGRQRIDRGLRAVYATASGLSDHNAAIAESRLSGMFTQKPVIQRRNCYCSAFFDEFYFSLDT